MPMYRAAFHTALTVALLWLPTRSAAQPTPAPETRKIVVNGRSIRVSTIGIEGRAEGQPVVVLEAGAGAGLDEWAPAMAPLAALAPVIAYDRHGIGGSDPDTQRRTIRRVAEALHELLETMRVPPPYVLVGHSWGGILIRAFAEQYGAEVAGLAFIETMDVETTRQCLQ